MNRILLVEDEAHIAEGLRFNLEAEGYAVEVFESGEPAAERLREAPEQFDLLVLDVMLPGKSGFEIIRELREERQFIPTLMLTARSRPEDVLNGFESGADDYLPKPFELPILIARIKGLLRRDEWIKKKAKPPEVYSFNGKSIDFDNLELRIGDKTVPLTLMEANLLRFLIQHEGQAVSRRTMLEQVWGVREDTDTRAIDNFVVRLRRYIEDEPSQPRHLVTVRGVGYRFIASPA
jgi:DNA-binding response OmpR family regulator